VTHQLDKETDQLNKLLAEVEECFVAMKLSVQAEVPLSEEEAKVLGFGRLDKAWGLYVVRHAFDTSPIPIQSASRAEKVTAVRLLGTLKKELMSEHERWLTEVRCAITGAREFIAQEKGSPP
jgi:hypothetical protein